MAVIKKYAINAPRDPEIREKVRDLLEYYMVFPDGYNEREKYGLVFCISGYGETIDSEYYLNKLCTYISDNYNIISVGVRYHNDQRTSGEYVINIPHICSFYNVTPDYFSGIAGKTILDRLFDLIIERGLLSLDRGAALLSKAYHQYSSFGFMPAIDHLFVLYNILKSFNIDRRNIIAFGTSYGGYIASLMAKYAPHTFSLVIDNSGFCITQLEEVLGSQLGGATGAIPRYKNGKRYELPINCGTLWSLNENSEYYFSDAHKQIRSLLVEEHRVKSNTMYCCYHSVKDRLVPVIFKDKMYEILSRYNPTYYKRVEDKDIDGELFKTAEHGMNASLRRMFDISMDEYRKVGHIDNEATDFDLELTYKFVCMDKQYNFAFSNKGIDVSIAKIKIESELPLIEIPDNVVYIDECLTKKNETWNNTETVQNILNLIPTMKEGMDYIQQNGDNGNLKDGFGVAQDFMYCIKSIESSIQFFAKSFPENTIENKTNGIRQAVDILLEEYKMNQRQDVINTINSQVIPLFREWEEEVVRVLEIFI